MVLYCYNYPMNKYQTISQFMADQPSDIRSQIELLRKIILAAEPSLEEGIKWNAPSFSYQGQDRLTFNVMNKFARVGLVLHRGAAQKEDKTAKPVIDGNGLVDWKSNIRGLIIFDDLKDIQAKQTQVTTIIQDWIKPERPIFQK